MMTYFNAITFKYVLWNIIEWYLISSQIPGHNNKYLPLILLACDETIDLLLLLQRS